MRLAVATLSNPDFQSVFHGTAIDRCTQSELTVTGRARTIKDPTIIAGSFDLSSLLGSRFDLIIVDDAVSRESTRTEAARQRAVADFDGIAGSRITPGGEIHVCGTSEHTGDLLHELAKRPNWNALTLPALDSSGQPSWPQRWPLERILTRQRELGPVRGKQWVDQVAIDEASLVFHPDLISQALAQGVAGLEFSPIGGRCVIGVDPAWTTGPNSDLSGIVLVTIDDAGFRHVTHVEGLRLNTDALPTSASSKAARVEWLAAELAAGRWAFRNMPDGPGSDLKQLAEDLVTFSFEGHTGDRLSALLIATEGVRKFEARPKAKGWFHFDPPTGRSFFAR